MLSLVEKLLDAMMILEKDLRGHSRISMGGRVKSSISLNFGAERLICYFPASMHFSNRKALTYTLFST